LVKNESAACNNYGHFFILVLGGIFYYSVSKNVVSKKEISAEDMIEIDEVREKFAMSDMHDPSSIHELFLKIDLERSLTICEEELILNSISCYRLLAISKPEKKEIICANINADVCEKYPEMDNCINWMRQHQNECLLLLPFLR